MLEYIYKGNIGYWHIRYSYKKIIIIKTMAHQLKIYAFSVELKLVKLFGIQCSHMKYIICSYTTYV